MDEFEQSTGTKTIREAAEDGTLIDVTDSAKIFGMPCRTFISQGFWNKVVLNSHEQLLKTLKFLTEMYHYAYGFDRWGPSDFKTYSCFLEPNKDLGLVMVITEFNKENDLGLKRMTGNTSRYWC